MYGIDTSLGLRDGPESGRKKVLVEFSSPNIAREFTAAHLRSTILGAFVANMYEAMGWDVVRINYLGDWGKHLGLLGVGWQKYGSEKVLNEQTDLFRYIHDLYTKMEDELQPEQEARKKARDDGQDAAVLETQGLFAERDATFKRMEDGEPEATVLWKKLRDISIEYYVDTYARLNIKFDEYPGESQVSLNPEAVAEVESILKYKGIYEEQDGAWVIDYDKHGARLGTAIVRGRNGSTTYLLRDIATVFDRFKTHSFDKMLYVVCEQGVHFRQVFKAVELMGHADIADKLQHITFAKASGPSSHLGNAQLLGDILDQCENHMREAMGANPDQYQIEDYDAVAKVMGINSLVVQELYSKKAHSHGIGFNLMTSLEGETGPNLQLCYARLCSAIASIGARPTPEEIPHIDYSSLWEAPWCELLRLMARYPDVTNSAFKTLEPGTILSYLFRVVEELTFCLDEADEDESQGEGSTAGSKYAARAVLYENVRQVLENGMKLLGTTPISK
jgi:arginyl-tRNA synthetase